MDLFRKYTVIYNQLSVTWACLLIEFWQIPKTENLISATLTAEYTLLSCYLRLVFASLLMKIFCCFSFTIPFCKASLTNVSGCFHLPQTPLALVKLFLKVIFYFTKCRSKFIAFLNSFEPSTNWAHLKG